MDYIKYFRNHLDIDDVIASYKFKQQFRKEHPEYFDPDGILVFCGPQGSGKTLSAVSYVLKLAKQYPNMILVSNMEIAAEALNGVEQYRYEGLEDLSKYSNGYAGVCFLLDEIQIEFNSLESKNIDPAVITEIAQQRKQRKHIVGTSQVFNRIAKPFREQFKYAVQCKCWGGLLQHNKIVKGEDCIVDDTGEVKTEHVKHVWWFHSPALYKSYNTYAKILRLNDNDFKGGKKK